MREASQLPFFSSGESCSVWQVLPGRCGWAQVVWLQRDDDALCHEMMELEVQRHCWALQWSTHDVGDGAAPVVTAVKSVKTAADLSNADAESYNTSLQLPAWPLL